MFQTGMMIPQCPLFFRPANDIGIHKIIKSLSFGAPCEINAWIEDENKNVPSNVQLKILS